MHFQFTPAAERALLAATAWSVRADTDELDVPEVLLGLLAEPECRAALLLASRSIGAPKFVRIFRSWRTSNRSTWAAPSVFPTTCSSV